MYDRENDNRNNNEGRQVQQELEDQLRAFGDTMTDAFAHGFEGRGMDIGDRAWDVGKAAVHAANYGIGEAAKAFRQGRRGYPYGDAKQPFREGAAGLRAYERKIAGYTAPDAILTGLETRTSSPVRLKREEDFVCTQLAGLYPCGEGAGYAGGIMSAAVDGLRVARAIISRYAPAEG